MYDFRTDLANERRDLYEKANNLENGIDGIESQKEEINSKIKIERVKILDENGENAIGKPIGTYVTIDVKDLKIATEDDNEVKEIENNLENIKQYNKINGKCL